MNELQNFIVKKGLEKASIEVIKEAIRQEPNISADVKEFWFGVIRGYSVSKDVYDVLEFLRRNK